MDDKIDITILPDGSMKIETDKISAANHGGAEVLVQQLIKAMGGKVRRERKGHSHHHDHKHNHRHH